MSKKMQVVTQDTPYMTYAYTVYNTDGVAVYEVFFSQIHQAYVRVIIEE